MAVVATTTYLYTDVNLNPFYVQGSQVTDRGPWSSLTSYAYPDVVQIGVDQYVAIAPNTNTPPSGIVDENWSALVVVEEQSSVVNAGSDYYARLLATLALETAWVGTQIGSSAYNYAEAAYNLAIIGTNNPGGFSVGTDAYYLAESGTNIGWAAYLLAQIGTNTGTAALNAAASAQSTANSAFSIAVIGTNAAANANAFAEIAWQLAQFGTNTGTLALNNAATAQSTADSAFSIAVIGTNAAATANAYASIAWQLAQFGTNTGSTAYSVAQSAWALAQLGTIIPPLSSLPDVFIPAPTAQQHLVFDGSRWTASDAMSTGAVSAFTYYLDVADTGTDAYETLLPSPAGGTEVVEVRSGGSGATTWIDSYLTSYLNRTQLTAGIWTFNNYIHVDYGSNSAQIIADAYQVSINGTETLLFSGTSAAFNSTTPVLVPILLTQGTYPTSATDKLGVRYWFTTPSPSVAIYFYHNGTTHYTNIQTPLTTSHNDLAGLQGGTTQQFYHTTLDQNEALRGTVGNPSDGNRYVTQTDLTIQAGSVTSIANSAYYTAQSGSNTANSAFSIAIIGTNTGSAAYDLAALAYALATAGTTGQANLVAFDAWQLAQFGTNTGTAAYNYAAQAYNLAVTGTNAVITEQGTRSQEDQFLQNQISVLQSVLGLSFAGTVTLFTAQVRYGKPDTNFTLIDGVLASREDSKFVWEDFDSYGTTTGTTPVGGMTDGSSWNGNGSIFTNNLWIGVNGTDWMNLYPTGTITSTTLNNGTGWSGAGTSWGDVYWYRFLGTDTFESYGTGTLSISGTEINAGGGWVGTAQCYTGSNRP